MGTFAGVYYSVRVKSLISISEKSYKAIAFDGSEAIIPKSQVMGFDFDVQKSDAYWISSWILERREDFQWSSKKSARFTKDGRRLPDVIIEHHIPDKVNHTEINVDETLIRKSEGGN